MFWQPTWHPALMVRLLCMIHYDCCVPSPFLERLCNKTMFVGPVTHDKQGTGHTEGSIKMRTILELGTILEVLPAKRTITTIIKWFWKFIVMWRIVRSAGLKARILFLFQVIWWHCQLLDYTLRHWYIYQCPLCQQQIHQRLRTSRLQGLCYLQL